jgi:hypothetical protein
MEWAPRGAQAIQSPGVLTDTPPWRSSRRQLFGGQLTLEHLFT